MRLLRNQGTTIALRLALLVVTCLLLFACGSGDSVATTTDGVAQPSAAQPTPVPTTPPLSLPPADASLPALAALPAAGQALDPVPATQAPATTASDQPGATPEAQAAAEVAATTGSDTTSTTAITPPNAAQSTEQATVDSVTVTSALRWSDCVLAAAQSADATAVLDPIAAGTTTDMTSVQLNTLATASVGCDIVASNLATTDLADYVPTAASCLNAWLESSGGGSVFVGLTSIRWGQPTPGWAQPHLIDALDACLTGSSFAADVMADVSTDPSLSGAFDAGCLATSFDSSGTMRAFAQALALDPSTANLFVGLDDAWVLACANVGQMVAVAAAADGVALSESTVSCIDSELKGTGVVAELIAGIADTDAVGIATIACLTNAEAAALLG